MVNDTNLAIILALIEKPLATDLEIQEIIKNKSNLGVNLSISTINRRVNSLFEKNIIQGAVPEIHFPLLGMQLHSFLLNVNTNNWKKNMDLLKRFFDVHPYTNFQCRVYGPINGSFCQFVLPNDKKALEHLKNTFNILEESNILVGYEHLPIVDRSVSTPMSHYYSDYNFNKWDIEYDKVTEELTSSTEKYIPNKYQSKSILDEIQPLDLIILRELTRNARRSQSEILNFAKHKEPFKLYDDYFGNSQNPSSKPSFSRRYNFLLESGIISHFELAYDRYQFGMFNQALYIGNKDPIRVNGLQSSIKKGYIPFPSRLSFSPEKYIFWVNLPPTQLIHFPDVLLDYFSDLQIYLFGRFPSKYYFYHKNFDVDNKKWKISNEWMVDMPLKAIGQY